MDILLKNARCAVLEPAKVRTSDLRISNGKILESGRNLYPRRGEEVVDINGHTVMPGLVCAHTHLYSSLSRGMPGPSRPPKNFLEILQKIWWKLDRALDEESIYFSALVGAIEAAKCGTTTIVDHHASPTSIGRSLDIIQQGLESVGLRGVLCYEVTDRGGRRERDMGLEENDRYISSRQFHPQFRGTVGAHASFTLSNESLSACASLAERHGTGVHIHTAEGEVDARDATRRHHCSLSERLANHGILRKQSILAHCVGFRHRDFVKARKGQSWVVHNPRSNMNNAVGHAPLHLFGTRAAIGSDGFPADMFEETRCGFFRNQEVRDGVPGPVLAQLLQGGQRLISEIFGERFGTFEPGAAADLVVLDYFSPTPVTDENLRWHFLFGMRSSMVESVMVNGKWVVWNRQLLGVDEEGVTRKAAVAARKLWKRMRMG